MCGLPSGGHQNKEYPILAIRIIMITSEEFDKMICGADYSKEKDKSVWVVIPFKKPPIDKDLADFIEKMRQKLVKVFLIPKEEE